MVNIMKSKFLYHVLFAGIILIGLSANSLAIIKLNKDKLTFQVQKEPLGNIINEIINKCDVEIIGLKTREHDLVTFSADQEPVENVIKRLLKYLNESNYAFEYSKTRLQRVSVLPKAKGPDIVSKPVPVQISRLKPAKENKERAVRILKINEGTQAESLDLQKNDLIVEYDGNRIKSARQLVEAVKKKAPEESVEMVVVREGQPIRLVLNGGFIGVNILTVSVPKSKLGQ